MKTVEVQDVHIKSVTLWRFRVNDNDWWQIYDDNTTCNDVCRMHFNYPDGHDTWLYEGAVTVPPNASNEEKQYAYLKYITNIINGMDGE